MNTIPSITLPIILNGKSFKKNLIEIFKNKKIVIFGVPGAFTPTCSNDHLPGFIELSAQFQSQGIDDIYCLAVNDEFVMKSWIKSYKNGNKIMSNCVKCVV